MTLQTEFEFSLPRGFVDEGGGLHRHGVMRLATAMDEIAPLKDPRVKANEAYFTVIVLARVISRLGQLKEVTTQVIENLFAADLAYLQELYRRINEDGVTVSPVSCPHCQNEFEVDFTQLGGK